MSISYSRLSLATMLLTILLSLDYFPQSVKANFFSRVLKNRSTSREEKPAPSGATNAMGSDAQVGSTISYHEAGLPLVHLSNNNMIPLVGYGVGNLSRDLVSSMVMAALQDQRKTRLIDTAHKSDNEALVADGINRGVEKILESRKETSDTRIEVHVITKVWYTHLGYERTKISVRESLNELKPALDNPNVDLKVHILLHWPKCHQGIDWMDCEAEEDALPNHVKEAGPDPAQDPETAWRESWRALEDMYLSEEYPAIASIGVSNFYLDQIQLFESFARIIPHVVQVNVWSLLYDGHLVDYCHKRRIHMSVYNAMGGTVHKAERAPNAYNHIQKIAYDIAKDFGPDFANLTPAQVILTWLIQHGVTVIPRTSNINRLDENSSVALSRIPALSEHQIQTIAQAVEAYLSGNDMNDEIHVSVTFRAVSRDIMIYWLGHNDEEIRLAFVQQGDSFSDTTYPNHRFRTYDVTNKDIYVDHEITANFGEHAEIHVEL